MFMNNFEAYLHYMPHYTILQFQNSYCTAIISRLFIFLTRDIIKQNSRPVLFQPPIGYI